MEIKRTLKKNNSDEDSFNRLLNWLDEDRNESFNTYRFIQDKLIMYFIARGCAEAEDLTDKTFDRVSKKITLPNFTYEGNKLKYFFGFAKHIHLEYLRSRNLQINENVIGIHDIENEDFEEQVSEAKKSLQICLSKMGRKDRGLILKYYNVDSGREKEMRKKIAKKYKLSTNSLRVKVFRLKKILTLCVENIVKK